MTKSANQVDAWQSHLSLFYCRKAADVDAGGYDFRGHIR
jgi:hypothetical protein